MTRQELIEYCLTFPAAYEDYPFDKMANPSVWAIMRHSASKKTFAQIYERDEKLCINLKCDPDEADFLCQIYIDVLPRFHMNKMHCNTIVVGGDVPDDEVKRMIGQSYELIKHKAKEVCQMSYGVLQYHCAVCFGG